MPLLRYFVGVGSVLLALLFGADWLWSTDPVAADLAVKASKPASDTVVARIKSERKWPDRIEFDTRAFAIALPPVIASTMASATASTVASASTAVTVAPGRSPSEAHAELMPTPVKVSAVKTSTKPRTRTVHRRSPRWSGSTWASASPSWSWRW